MTPHGREIEKARKMCKRVGATLNVLHQVGKLRGSAGIPDCYIQWPGRAAVWWECKCGRDTLSPAQTAFGSREAGSGKPHVLVGDAGTVADWIEEVIAGYV